MLLVLGVLDVELSSSITHVHEVCSITLFLLEYSVSVQSRAGSNPRCTVRCLALAAGQSTTQVLLFFLVLRE